MHRNHKANLTTYPKQITITPGLTYTVGDLHGHTMKLMYFLVLHGAATPTTEQYIELYIIYEEINCDDYSKPAVSSQRFKRFAELLDEIEFCNNSNLFRLIGDVLADRGANDGLTLLVLQKMKDAGINYEINLSNHDLEYVAKMEGANTSKAAIVIQPDPERCYTHSMHSMWTCIEKGVLQIEDIKALHQKVVAPHLRLFTLDRAATGQPVISAHAPILLQAVFHAGVQLGIQTEQTTVEQFLAETTVDQLDELIDAINRKIMALAEAGRLTTESAPADIQAIALKLKQSTENYQQNKMGPEHPFVHATWARELRWQDYKPANTARRRLNIIYMHGHIGDKDLCIVEHGGPTRRVTKGYLNLDRNTLGKDGCRLAHYSHLRNIEGVLQVASTTAFASAEAELADHSVAATDGGGGGGGGGGGQAERKHSATSTQQPGPLVTLSVLKAPSHAAAATTEKIEPH